MYIDVTHGFSLDELNRNNMLNGHGGNLTKICSAYGLAQNEIIDFSASVNPLGYPDGIRNALLERFDEVLNYPDSECTELRETISKIHSCKGPNIIVGNGSNELFYLIPRALGPKKGVLMQPTFSEFRDALDNANVEIEEIINNEVSTSLKPNLDDTRLVNFKEGIVFLCNPNNPTGQLVEKEEILKLVKDSPKRMIVVDEAFMDFVEDHEKYSVIKEASLTDNLIVVRSLTKFYGFPGLRLGFLIACDAIVKKLLRYKEPWTVNALAQIAGQVAINDRLFTRNTKEFISKEKAYLYNGLSKINGLHPFPPSVNFILIKIDNDEHTSQSVFEFLIKRNIIIRDCSNFTGLNNKYFRVAVRTRDEDQMLLSALRKMFGT